LDITEIFLIVVTMHSASVSCDAHNGASWK